MRISRSARLLSNSTAKSRAKRPWTLAGYRAAYEQIIVLGHQQNPARHEIPTGGVPGALGDAERGSSGVLCTPFVPHGVGIDQRARWTARGYHAETARQRRRPPGRGPRPGTLSPGAQGCIPFLPTGSLQEVAHTLNQVGGRRLLGHREGSISREQRRGANRPAHPPSPRRASRFHGMLLPFLGYGR
jgi:hypothetical protein